MTAWPANAYRVAPARVAATPDARAQTTSWSREWLYFGLVIAGWCFVPLLRRLIDWHNGYYNPIQVASVIPYALTLPLALVSFRRERLARLSRTMKVFAWVWCGTFVYGLFMALALGSIFSAVFEAQQYLVPAIVGIWLAGSPLDIVTLSRRVRAVILVASLVVAAYGLLQFVQPAPWDVLWIEGGGYSSMGQAVPFGLRIFSTLNSTGPAADFLAIAMLFALPAFRPKAMWMWPALTLLGAALLLTLVREAWVGLILGVTAYFFLSPRRLTTLPLIAVYGVLLASLIATLPAFLGADNQSSDSISTRLATLGDVGHDSSAVARTLEIQEAFATVIDRPLGDGLGQIGASARLNSNAQSANGTVLDSGYLARMLELGWAGFAGYAFVVVGSIVALLLNVVRAMQRGSRDAAVAIASAASVCVALAWSDAAGDAHLAVAGLLFWIALGVGLRPLPATANAPRRPSVRSS